MLDFNGKKANIAVVDTGNGSAPTSSDGLVNGKGGFWLDTTNHQMYVMLNG